MTGRVLTRQKHWRNRLIAWAKEIQGLPYEWGHTDCAALVRTALELQFGEDVLWMLPTWSSADVAKEVWASFARNGGSVGGLLTSLGAQHLLPRHMGARYPMGSVLVLQQDPDKDDMCFPSFGVSLAQYVVQSHMERGVYWAVGFEVEAAWLLEEVRLNG